MKLYYEPKWEIKDPRVESLDEKRIKLNRFYSILEMQREASPRICQSLETISRRRDLICYMEKKIKNLESGKKAIEGFDRVVLDDIKDNVRKARADDSYFHNPKSKLTLGVYLATLFGRGAYSKISGIARPERLDHEALHDYYDAMHDIWAESLDSSIIIDRKSFDSQKHKLLEVAKSYKEQINQFYEHIAVVDTPLGYSMDFAQSGTGFSYWDGSNLLMVLDPDKIPVYKTKDKYVIHKTTGLLIGIHEFAHALEEIISQKCMPRGLHYDNKFFSRISHGTVCEGVALFAEEVAMNWFSANIAKSGLDLEELKIAESARRAYVPEKVQQVEHDIEEMEEFVKIIEDKVPSQFRIEAHKKLASVTGLKIPLRDVFLFDDRQFDCTLLDLSYIMGERRVKKLLGKVKNEGLRNSRGKGLLLQAMMTGAWSSPKCQERFILEHFLPRARKDGVL